MSTKRRAAGLKSIDAWEEWLVDANRQRLCDAGLDGDAFEKEFTDAKRMIMAVAERMREDFLARIR